MDDDDINYDINPFEAEAETDDTADSGRTAKRGRRPVSRGKLARVADLAVRFSAAKHEDLAQLAKLVGSSRTDAASLAVACVEGDDPSSVVAKIVELRSMNPVDLAVSCIVLGNDRDGIKPLWDAVGTLVALPPRVPRDPTTAGASLAKAIAGLNSEQVAALSAPLDLLG